MQARAIFRARAFHARNILHQKFGNRLPAVRPVKMPGPINVGAVRLAKIIRYAPENGREAINGLGVLGDGPAVGTPNPAGFWDKTGQAAGTVLSAGLQVLQSREQQKAAAAAAAAEQRLAALTRQKAEAEQQALMQANQLATARAQAEAQRSSTMKWVAIAGGGLAVVGIAWFLLKRRKSA